MHRTAEAQKKNVFELFKRHFRSIEAHTSQITFSLPTCFDVRNGNQEARSPFNKKESPDCVGFRCCFSKLEKKRNESVMERAALRSGNDGREIEMTILKFFDEDLTLLQETFI